MNSVIVDGRLSPISNQSPPLNDGCPAVSLPPELLSEIFILAHPNCCYRHQIPFEVVLSHVSGRWRDVAISIPELWKKIHIYSPQSLKWVPRYLQRSGAYFDLDIDLYKWEKSHRTSGPQIYTVLIQAIAQEILPHFHRIRNMLVICYLETTCKSILHSILRAAAAPNLQQLQIKFDRRTIPRPSVLSEEFRILEQGSPQLKMLTFEQADNLPVPSSLCNLTTLHLHCLHPDSRLTYPQLVEVLTSPNALQYLSFQGDLNFATWPLHLVAPEFQLNHLKALRFIDNGMMAVRMLLSMSAPKLESIWLDCSYDNFDFLFDAPQMAGNNKFPKLRYLTIPTDNLIRMVKFATIFPSITHLHLPYPDFSFASHLETALTSHWISLHSIVFTMLRGANWRKFNPCFAAVLPRRREASRPIKGILLDRDFFQGIRKAAPELIPQVEMEIVSSSNYKEPWWNKEDLVAT